MMSLLLLNSFQFHYLLIKTNIIKIFWNPPEQLKKSSEEPVKDAIEDSKNLMQETTETEEKNIDDILNVPHVNHPAENDESIPSNKEDNQIEELETRSYHGDENVNV